MALVVAAASAATTGCGDRRASTPPTVRSGHEIFTRSCVGCHTLTGHESGAPGGDLATTNLSVRDLASFARVMPVRPPLTPAQADAVARYVHAVARRRHN
ncbi:MAG TPA: cytochrome c [Gaiellaceae bacterium]|nr:cytochrome c [Gaiellaceae bacterium]